MGRIFELETEGAKKFICNSENGKWVLANYRDQRVDAKIEGNFEKQNYTGTSLIVINLTRKCNFQCIYCHVRELKGEETDMNPEIGRKIIDRTLELEEPYPPLVFHGSEPLMNFALIKEMVDYSTGKGDFQFRIQTNGSLLDRDKLEFLVGNNIRIGISLDGCREHQDKTRPYFNGSSSYSEVSRNLNRLKDRQETVSVICVVTKHNVDDLEIIADDYDQRQIGGVLFSPVHPNELEEAVSPDPKIFSANLKKVLDKKIHALATGQRYIDIRNLSNYLLTLFNKGATSNCVQCSFGTNHPLIAVDVDGAIYPCDHFWGRGSYKIGNILENSLEESLNSPRNFRVSRDINCIEPCSMCNWKRFCGGGCLGGAERLHKTVESRDSYCTFRREIFEYSVRKLSFLHGNNLISRILSRFKD